LVRIDVTVLDKKTRKPVRGLTADDFVVKVGGQPQAIQAVAEVDTTSRSSASGPAWQDTAVRDVVTNDISANRLIAIVMDDAHGGLWHRQAGKKVAHKIIDGLGPGDLAAVVFVNKTQFAQDFTADRALLRAAVETFDPLANPRFAGLNAPATIKNVRTFLSTVAQYRRAVMVVTWRGYDVNGTGAASPAWAWLRDAGLIDEDRQGAPGPYEVGSRIGHVPIHFFTTYGLTVSTNPAARSAGNSTTMLAQIAGGRAIVEHNAPQTEVASVLDELSSHYELAYRPSFPFDGKLRYADIIVNRPDVLVLPASGAFRTARESDDGAVKRRVKAGSVSGLMDAVAAPLMSGELPLRLSTLAVAVPGSKQHAVAITLGLPVPREAGVSEPFAVTTLLHDGEGRTELLRQTQTVSVTGSPGRTGRRPRSCSDWTWHLVATTFAWAWSPPVVGCRDRRSRM
jgi:hypothetical protein